MRLEYCYRNYLIKLLSYPKGEGWVPHFQVFKSLGDKDEVRTMTEIDQQSFATLEEANEVAGKLAEAWVDQRIQTEPDPAP